MDSFSGTPWLVNDFINKSGLDGEYIFFMVTGDDGGLGPTRGVTGIYVWVSMPTGYAVGSQGALSIIRNFTPVADCGGG